MNKRTNEQTNKRTDEQTNRRTNEQTNKRTNEQTNKTKKNEKNPKQNPKQNHRKRPSSRFPDVANLLEGLKLGESTGFHADPAVKDKLQDICKTCVSKKIRNMCLYLF